MAFDDSSMETEWVMEEFVIATVVSAVFFCMDILLKEVLRMEPWALT